MIVVRLGVFADDRGQEWYGCYQLPCAAYSRGAVDAFRITLAILLLLIAPLIKKVTLLIDALDVNTAIA